MPKVSLLDWGIIDYRQAWEQQTALYEQTIQQKLANRTLPIDEQVETHNYLIICQHPSTYTMGVSGRMEHLLVDETTLAIKGAKFYKVNRGGDITFHGYGQCVGYPILDLHHFFTDISRLMRTYEEVIIRTLSDFGIIGNRLPEATGVWIDPDLPNRARKICAMGIRSSRWVTLHGWALNINTDVAYFDHIVPCGITNKSVTSMHLELGQQLDEPAVKERIIHHFADLFEVVWT
jgi:lipoyl(octanoyl) transferase